MFENFAHMQAANQLKRLISQIRPLGDGDILDKKRRALAAVGAFESCGWHSWLLDEAVERAGPGRIVLAVDGKLSHESGADRPGEAAETILTVLLDYLQKAGCEAPVLPTMQVLLTVKEAADYLGISPRTVRNYVYESGHLTGMVRGKTMFFSKDELDLLKANPPQDGRPRAAR